VHQTAARQQLQRALTARPKAVQSTAGISPTPSLPHCLPVCSACPGPAHLRGAPCRGKSILPLCPGLPLPAARPLVRCPPCEPPETPVQRGRWPGGGRGEVRGDVRGKLGKVTEPKHVNWVISAAARAPGKQGQGRAGGRTQGDMQHTCARLAGGASWHQAGSSSASRVPPPAALAS